MNADLEASRSAGALKLRIDCTRVGVHCIQGLLECLQIVLVTHNYRIHLIIANVSANIAARAPAVHHRDQT